MKVGLFRAFAAGVLTLGLASAGIVTAPAALAAETPIPKADILDVDFADGTPTDRAQGLASTTWGAPVIGADAALGKNAATFDSDAYSYPFAAQYGKVAKSATLECVFRYNDEFPASGEDRGNLCANKEAGGFAITVYGKKLTFITHVGGGYKSVGIDIEPGRWYHTLGVWDGSTIKLYVNGELKGQTNASGAFKKPTDASYHFTVGADSGGSNRPQFFAPATISAARVYSAAITAAEAAALNTAAFEARNTALTPRVTSTVPADGAHLVSPVTLSAVIANEEHLSRPARYTLDGVAIQPGAQVGPGLSQGTHVLAISATDVFGTDVSRSVTFTSETLPSAGGVDTDQASGTVSLSAVVTSPTGNQVTTAFREMDVAVADGGSQGVLGDIPTTRDFVGTEHTSFAGALKPADGVTVASPASADLPYQRFTVPASAFTEGQKLVWSGATDPTRSAVLRVWNAGSSVWEKVAETRGSANGTVSLTANITAAHHDAGAVHVLVTGEDPFADDLNKQIDNAFENPDDYDFAIAHLTDTQYLSEGAVKRPNEKERAVWKKAYTDVTQWIADNAKERKIAYAAHTGDIIENWISAKDYADPAFALDRAKKEFEVASEAQKILEASGIPNSVLPGNHDNRTGTDNGPGNLYNQYFGPSRYLEQAKQQSWKDAGASYHPWREGDNDNHYDLFTAGGLDFIAVGLGFSVTAEEVEWANQVLEQYKDRNAIVLTHAYNAPSINPDGRGSRFSFDGRTLLDGVISKNSNVFLVLSGHEHGVSIEVRKDVGQAGNHVVELLADYQFYKVGSDELGITELGGYSKDTPLQFGSSFFRMLQFDVARSELSVDTYSPLLDNFGATEYDDRKRYNGKEDDFRLPIQLETRKTSFATDAVALATPSDRVIGETTVASGAPATVTWAGLTAGEVYGWEAVSRDALTGRALTTVINGVSQFALFTATAAGTDVTAPQITLPAGATTVTVGDPFDPLAGVSAWDESDGDVTASVEVHGTVDTTQAGVYALTYLVRDANGNQQVASRAVTVVAAPVVPEPGTQTPPTGEVPSAPDASTPVVDNAARPSTAVGSGAGSSALPWTGGDGGVMIALGAGAVLLLAGASALIARKRASLKR